MFNLHLITLGKLKETYWLEAETEYLKRLGPYLKIQIHELREEAFTEKDNPEKVKQKEAEKIKTILEKIKNPFIICLDERGKEFTSAELAERLKIISEEEQNIVVIIGGPLGLHPSIVQLSKQKIALSKLTFTHQMARIFWLEQIYRSCMINANRNYHH